MFTVAMSEGFTNGCLLWSYSIRFGKRSQENAQLKIHQNVRWPGSAKHNREGKQMQKRNHNTSTKTEVISLNPCIFSSIVTL